MSLGLLFFSYSCFATSFVTCAIVFDMREAPARARGSSLLDGGGGYGEGFVSIMEEIRLKSESAYGPL